MLVVEDQMGSDPENRVVSPMRETRIVESRSSEESGTKGEGRTESVRGIEMATRITSKSKEELAYETSLSIDQEFAAKTLALVRILFASCGIRLKTRPGEAKHFTWSKLERVAGNFVGCCQFLAVPYLLYYRVLNGKSASFWGSIYLTIANLTSPFCYLWARFRGRKNQYALELLTLAGNEIPRGVLVAVARMLIWALATTFIMQALYFYWLFCHKRLITQDKIWMAFFTFMGCTAYVRIMLPMLSTGVFLIHCYALRTRMKKFLLRLQGTLRLVDVVNEFLLIDQAMQKSMDGWALYFVAIFLIPLVCFQIQIIMVAQHVMHIQEDYFFMIYSGHFFMHAMTVLWVAGRLTEYWRHAASTIRLRLARSDLSLSASQHYNLDLTPTVSTRNRTTLFTTSAADDKKRENIHMPTKQNNNLPFPVLSNTRATCAASLKLEESDNTDLERPRAEAATQGFNAFVIGCLNNPSGFVILGVVIDTQLAAYITYIVAMSALYMSRMFLSKDS